MELKKGTQFKRGHKMCTVIDSKHGMVSIAYDNDPDQTLYWVYNDKLAREQANGELEILKG